MKDIFLDFETAYQDYKSKKDLCDKMYLYHFDILDSLYKNILELKEGNDSICLDNMDYSEYVRLVSNEFKEMVKEYQAYLNSLEKELIGPSFDYKRVCNEVISCSLITLADLLELFDLLHIKYIDVSIPDGIYNDSDETLVTIIENGILSVYEFSDFINLISIKDGEIIINPIIEYLLGTDFIRFFVNYKYNTSSYDIKAICSEYKKSCLNR